MFAKNNEKRSSMLFTLLLSIGLTIASFSVIQIFIISGVTKVSVEKDDTEMYDNTVEILAHSLINTLEGYKKELNFYVYADMMQLGTFDEIGEWLVAHESVRSNDFDYIMFADKDGYTYNDIGSRTKISERPYFKAIMFEGKDSFIGDPVVSKTTGQAVVHIARAVKKNGNTIAMIAGVVNLNKLTQIVNEMRIGEAGYAWMLASSGLVMSHPNSDFVMVNNFVTDAVKGFEKMMEVCVHVAAGEEGSSWVRGLNGSADYVTYHGIEGTPWGLAITVPGTQIFKLSDKIRNTLVCMGIVTILITIFIGGIFLWRTITPLSVVERTINGIASGNADLTKRLDFKSNNEIGYVVKGFNAFAAKLQAIIGDVKASKNDLSLVGEDMTASAQDTVASITQILANIESVHNQIINQSSSVEETAGAVNQIASNIVSLERMISNQSAGVTQASAAVEEMIGNISSVNQSVDKMFSSFETLIQSSHEGGTVLQGLSDSIGQMEIQSQSLQEANTAIAAIAEQTNLLAMNAAIEAAHAGEAGKGFSVVADEIRKLSETSGNQSKTIGDQLLSIQNTISSVVTTCRVGLEAFSKLESRVHETEQLVVHIKSAMEEQNEGSKQISDTLHSMNDSTIEVRNASSEMSEGNKAILEEIRNLQTVTAVMKDSMNEMSVGARKINETGMALNEIAVRVKDSISKIGTQIDQFKV